MILSMTDSFNKEEKAIFMRYFAIFPKIQKILFKKVKIWTKVQKSGPTWRHWRFKRLIFHTLLYIGFLVLINYMVFSGPWGLYKVILGLGQYQITVLKSPGKANINYFCGLIIVLSRCPLQTNFFVEAIIN